MQKEPKGLGIVVSIFMIAVIAAAYLWLQPTPVQKVYSDLVMDVKSGMISELEIGETVAKAKYIELDENGKSITNSIEIPSRELFDKHAGSEMLSQIEAKKLTVKYPAVDGGGFWLSLLAPMILLLVLIIGWVIFTQKSKNGGNSGSNMSGPGRMMNFGKSNAKVSVDTSKKVTFDDVAGVDEEKEELSEIVEFLKAPRKFVDLGARIPKGVLLIGPPGTGKTLLAKAVAGEAEVPFFSISGSDFVEMYVGVGASRVRDLFEQAKRHQPSIIFIDEIDAVGRHRGAGMGGGHDEREQTLNQLLVEMDGFGVNEGVIVIAATNRADILDPALMRSGRFDRQVYVGYPDQKGREEILKVHAKNKPLGADVDLAVVAKTTYGFTGADLENLLNEAALLAARSSKKEINQQDIDDAMLKVTMGPEKKSKKVTEENKRKTAYHEAGHAIITTLLPTQDPVHRVSIVPRGGAGGFMMSLPLDDKSYVTKAEMEEDLMTYLAGRIAEDYKFGEINTGASSDIERATKLAKNMVVKYGMSELGSIAFSSDEEVFVGKSYGSSRSYSEKTAAEIDSEISRFMNEAYAKCKELLLANVDKLENVAKALIEKESLNNEEFMEVFNGEKGNEE